MSSVISVLVCRACLHAFKRSSVKRGSFPLQGRLQVDQQKAVRWLGKKTRWLGQKSWFLCVGRTDIRTDIRQPIPSPCISLV